MATGHLLVKSGLLVSDERQTSVVIATPRIGLVSHSSAIVAHFPRGVISFNASRAAGSVRVDGRHAGGVPQRSRVPPLLIFLFIRLGCDYRYVSATRIRERCCEA